MEFVIAWYMQLLESECWIRWEVALKLGKKLYILWFDLLYFEIARLDIRIRSFGEVNQYPSLQVYVMTCEVITLQKCILWEPSDFGPSFDLYAFWVSVLQDESLITLAAGLEVNKECDSFVSSINRMPLWYFLLNELGIVILWIVQKVLQDEQRQSIFEDCLGIASEQTQQLPSYCIRSFSSIHVIQIHHKSSKIRFIWTWSLTSWYFLRRVCRS